MNMNLKIRRYNTTNKVRRTAADVFFLITALTIFAGIGMAMLLLPRSAESILEQRNLAEAPEYSSEAFRNGSYSAEMNAYFSDTVPFRDKLMVLSSALCDLTGFRSNDIKLHNVAIAENSGENLPLPAYPLSGGSSDRNSGGNPVPPSGNAGALNSSDPNNQGEYSDIEPIDTDSHDTDDTVNITNNGIAVVGTRALMLYGGNYTVGTDYAAVISKYKQELGRDVNVYSMVIPTSVEFYCPEDVQPFTSSQLDNINNIYSHLTDGVRSVDAYTQLALHTDEPIYLRTDHHWSSLGAYYAAKAFAETAGVPFAELSEYDEHIVDGYVGTMYSYSQDIRIKNNPEDFVYYVPKNVTLDTTYSNYILGENNEIVGIQSPMKSSFYIDFTKNKSMLYCTFMGGDAKITHVNTSTKNGRRLAIFKDSYGNALPQFLFGSFEDIYVLDMRYFTYNAVDFLKEKGVTDLLFANNAFHATTRSTVRYYENFLVQGRQTEETTAPADIAANGTVTASGGTGIDPKTTVPTGTTPSVTAPTVTQPPTTTTTVPAATTPPTVTTTPAAAPSQTAPVVTAPPVTQTAPAVTTPPAAATAPPVTVSTGTTAAQNNR